MCKGKESHPLMEAGLSTQAEMYIPEHTHTCVRVCSLSLSLSLSLTHTHTHTYPIHDGFPVSFLLKNSMIWCAPGTHGQRSLAGYSPWAWEELDTTEQLSTEHRPNTHTHTHTHCRHSDIGQRHTHPAEPRPLHQCTLAPWLRFPRHPCPPLKSQCVLVAQLCPTLCDPMDYSLPSSFVHGILQARILK